MKRIINLTTLLLSLSLSFCPYRHSGGSNQSGVDVNKITN
jgi:hypothetical protein